MLASWMWIGWNYMLFHTHSPMERCCRIQRQPAEFLSGKLDPPSPPRKLLDSLPWDCFVWKTYLLLYSRIDFGLNLTWMDGDVVQSACRRWSLPPHCLFLCLLFVCLLFVCLLFVLRIEFNLNGRRCCAICLQAFITAAPFRSVPVLPPVAVAFGTLSPFGSIIHILDF